MVTYLLQVRVRSREKLVPLEDGQILNVHVALSTNLLTHGQLSLLLDREAWSILARVLRCHVVETEGFADTLLLRFCNDHGLVDDIVCVDEDLGILVLTIAIFLTPIRLRMTVV